MKEKEKDFLCPWLFFPIPLLSSLKEKWVFLIYLKIRVTSGAGGVTSDRVPA
jgi:hypothetical protein